MAFRRRLPGRPRGLGKCDDEDVGGAPMDRDRAMAAAAAAPPPPPPPDPPSISPVGVGGLGTAAMLGSDVCIDDGREDPPAVDDEDILCVLTG